MKTKTEEEILKDTEKQVEELEELLKLAKQGIECSKFRGWLDLVKIYEEGIIELDEKARLLKADIEKGCGRNYIGFLLCGKWDSGDYCLCPTCQNIIQRLNKIIGDEE